MCDSGAARTCYLLQRNIIIMNDKPTGGGGAGSSSVAASNMFSLTHLIDSVLAAC